MGAEELSGGSVSLRHEYISLKRNGAGSYGGGQQWSRDKTMVRCGCGVIAGLDVLLYMRRNSPGCGGIPFAPGENGRRIPDSVYYSYAERLRKWLPLIPGRGINGLMLAGGLELFFLRCGLPYTIRWGVLSGSLFASIERMLRADLPVILAVGPNFPRFWRDDKLPLYTRTPDGEYRPCGAAKAHYVVVTGMDGEWLHISSWGREYYINRREYLAYGKAHSLPVLNSIAVISPRR